MAGSHDARLDSPRRVLLVSPDSHRRAGLASLLGVGRVAAAIEPGEAAAWLESEPPPDVILWDLGWGAQDVPPELGNLQETRIPVVVLVEDPGLAAEVRHTGGTSVLGRSAEPDVLAAALQAAATGLIVVDPLFDSMPQMERAVAGGTPEPLTPRETEVLQWLAEGLANKEIALRLGIRETTVKFHVNSILAKLGAQSRTEAVTRAARLGLILL